MIKFTNEEKLVLFSIIGAVIAGLVITLLFSYNKKIEESRIITPPLMVNINSAAAEELSRIPGIGPSYAAKIISYRNSSGGFKAPEDIMKVKGIGAKKFVKMKKYISVQDAPAQK